MGLNSFNICIFAQIMQKMNHPHAFNIKRCHYRIILSNVLPKMCYSQKMNPQNARWKYLRIKI